MNTNIQKRIFYLLIGIFTIYAVFPLYWMFFNSIKETSELLRRPPTLITQSFNFTFYERVIKYTPFLRYMLNTVVVYLGTALFNLVFASMAAYSLSYFNFKGKNAIRRMILIVYMFPQIILLLPLFVLLKYLGLIGSYSGLILSYLSITMPFSTWILIAYFDTVPKEITQAAKIDGCGNFKVFTKIMIPLVAPSLVVVFIFAFLNSWNEFLFAQMLISTSELRTLQAGFYTLLGSETLEWGPVLAWITMVAIPPSFLFVIIRRFIVKGLTAGAVKG